MPGTAADEVRPPCVAEALTWLESKLNRQPVLSLPVALRDWLRLKYGTGPVETFGTVFLDRQGRMIEPRELFPGTLKSTTVHVREVARQALAMNAAAVLLWHYRPDSEPLPTTDDRELNRKLKAALDLVGVSVADHVIVTAAAVRPVIEGTKP